MKHMYMNTRCGYMRIIAGLMVMVMIIVAIIINPAFYSYVWAEDEELKESDIVTAGTAGPDIDTPSAILMESKTGQIIYEKDASKQLAPASITKIMTLILIFDALESGQIKMEDPVTVSEHAASMGGSQVFLEEGEIQSVRTMIKCIAVASANDACVAMSEYICGSEDVFVDKMNEKAGQLGMEQTHFVNCCGLDADGQYSSARDMALIGQALIRDVPNEYSIYREKEFTFNGIRQLNRNGLLWDNSLNVDGIKTGHTDKAGYNLVASATEGQMRLISAVMGGRTFKGRESESKKLLTWGFRFFETVNPIKAGKEFASEPAWFGDSDRASLGVDKDVYLTIPRGRMKDLKASYVLNSSELHAPLQKNQVVGTINFQLDGKTIEQRPLVVLQEIPEGNFFGKIIDYIKLMFHHWFG